MPQFRTMLLAGTAVLAVSGAAFADDLAALSAQIEALDTKTLALDAAPVQPPDASSLAISKTPIQVAPDLPLSARDRAAFGDSATTLRVLPSASGADGSAISWSGYARAGIVYQGGK